MVTLTKTQLARVQKAEELIDKIEAALKAREEYRKCAETVTTPDYSCAGEIEAETRAMLALADVLWPEV